MCRMDCLTVLVEVPENKGAEFKKKRKKGELCGLWNEVTTVIFLTVLLKLVITSIAEHDVYCIYVTE